MSTSGQPHLAHGKICYLMIPTNDLKTSVAFYTNIFGWSIRDHEDGSVSFDDGAHEVSGTWVTGEAPQGAGGIAIHLMVTDIYETMSLIEKLGGKITEPVGRHAPELTAAFSDPTGNILWLFQERG